MSYFRTFKMNLIVFLSVAILNKLVEGHMVGNNPYRRVETLDPQGKFVLEWEVNRGTNRVTFNVTVATIGYVGFGLSANGKMSGADIVIGGVLPNGESYFSDRHAVANQIPEKDPSQDWDLHEARENGTHTFLRFSRAFDTCDPQDYPITEDKISLIWAYGEKDDELEYHYRNRGEFPVLLLHPDYTPPIKRDPETNYPRIIHSTPNEDVKVWTIDLEFIMPEEETTYWCTLHRGLRLSQKHHFIGFEMRFSDPVSKNHVHHAIITRCRAPQGFSDRAMFERFVDYEGQTCYGAGGRSQSVQDITGPIPTEYCSDYLVSTAVGNRILFLPPHVGTPLGEDEEEYYLVQTHYDNPGQRPGINVVTHLDMYYTPNLRQNEGELFVVRHESPGLPPSHLIPPSSVAHKSYGVCGSDCSRKIFPDEGIRIVGVLLHAHNSGVGLRFRHFRGNKELPFIAYEDNYAFNFQQMRMLPKEVLILPGDQLVVECTNDNTWTNGTVVGGFSTRQEMCAAWFFYYNKLPNHMICAAEIDSTEAMERFLGVSNVTWSLQHLEYAVTSPRGIAGLPVSQVSDLIDWSIEKREALQRFQKTHPYRNRCPIERYARNHRVDQNGEPMDLQPEEDEGLFARIPTTPGSYSPPKPCSPNVAKVTQKSGTQQNKYNNNSKNWSPTTTASSRGSKFTPGKYKDYSKGRKWGFKKY